MNKTEYGHKNVANETKTYTITTPNVDGSGNAFSYEIKYQVDNSRVKPDRISEDVNLNGANINNDFVGQNNIGYDSIIYNKNSIGDITGDFVGNSLSGGVGSCAAGITNSGGTINNIIGDFIGNYRVSANAPDSGAIANYSGSTISSITGNFIGNYSYSTATGQWSSYGGALYNSSKIGSINANFIGNYSYAPSSANGGAIYNKGSSYSTATIEDIKGDFIGNYAKGSSYAYGGAIYNYSNSNNNLATLGSINGDFIGNYAHGGIDAYGGAIYNEGTIGNIIGSFIGNYAISRRAYGGAIYSDEGIIGNITGDFIGNYAQSDSSDARGGAVYNYTFGTIEPAKIGDIVGNFIANFVQTKSTDTYYSAQGGAIYNYNYAGGSSITATIGNITGNFIDNYAQSQSGNAQGGAIYNYNGTIGDIINSSFINNYAKSETGSAQGGAIYTNKDLNIIAQNGGNSVFSGNYTEAEGVKTPNAIYVDGAKETGKSNIQISAVGVDRVTIKESNTTGFPDITLNASTNGTIQFDDQIQGSDGTFETTIKSGTMAISDELKPQLPSIGLDENATVSDLIAKYKEQVPSASQMTDEQIIAMFIQAGYIDLKDEQIISSDIKGSYDLKITGDKTGKVILNNDVINANISLDNTNLYLGRDNVFNQSQSLTLNSGSMSMINNQAGTMNIPTFNLNGTTNLGVDVDLANKQMDTIKATNYNVAQDAKLNVNSINLLNDAKQDKTDILFTDNKNLASATAYTGASPIAYSPIYKYEVSYNPDDGFFTFLRGGGTSGNASDAFNPAVLAPSVATQAGAYTTQLQTFNYAFQHSDTFMNIPYLERVAMINQNKYALSPTGDATDVGTFSPLLTKEQDAGLWVKPYASFESIPLNNGPKVSNINYGTLVGYDSSLTPIAKGWERVLTGYIGYNGASQRYSGVDAYQNGGILGGTATMYKGNFFNATTLSVGATAGDASTMYGNENYAMLLAGIGNKTGYNFEFKDGRIILQPNFLISYTFVNTFDYTNGAGVRIKSDPLNAIQLAPGLKLIGNTKNGWQPYLSVAMVWNLLDDSKVTANDVRLPEMSIDPYVQYGAGIQKRFKDRFIAFGQAMIHNGGRNGVSLTGGIRWSVGK